MVCSGVQYVPTAAGDLQMCLCKIRSWTIGSHRVSFQNLPCSTSRCAVFTIFFALLASTGWLHRVKNHNVCIAPCLVDPSFPRLLHQHVLCCTEDPPVSSWASLTGVRWHNFGNFWLFFEYPPNFRNLTAAANIIADNIAIQRLVTIQHLLRRHGLENYFWPENLIFTCDITLGSFCGLTTFSVMSFGLLATCVCGAKSESLYLNES